jgi:hypothetical protein
LLQVFGPGLAAGAEFLVDPHKVTDWRISCCAAMGMATKELGR